MQYLLENLVAHYKMNDTAASTVVIDSQGTSNGTSQRNTSLMTTAGIVNTALDFDGTNDWVNCNTNFLTILKADFTVCLWLKPDDGNIDINSEDIFGSYTANPLSSMFTIYHSDNDIYINYKTADVGLFPGPLYMSSTDAFTDGAQDWHFVVIAIYQNGAVVSGKLWINDTLVEGSSEAMVMTGFTDSGNLLIGQANMDLLGPAAGFEFAGPIDNVMVFDKALSDDEVAFIYNSGSGRETFEDDSLAILESADEEALLL